jgi:hypothetical protein
MTASLPILVSLAGLAVAGIGIFGVAAPAKLIRLLGNMPSLVGLPVTFALRIVFGSIFVLAAPECRLPTFVHLIGMLEFGGAAVLLGLGAARLERFRKWWLGRGPAFVRYWCLGASALGIALLYAGA